MTMVLHRAQRHAGGLFSLVRTPVKTLRFLFSRRAPWGPRLLALLALVYVVLPVDAIPDVAPVIGWLDDAGVAAIALGWLARAVREFDAAPPARRGAPGETSPDDQATAALTSS